MRYDGKKAGAILIDPPWHFKTWSDKGRGRAVPYDTMTLEEIAALPVGDWALDDSACFVWGLSERLPEAYALLEGYGFEPKTVAFVWVKTRLDFKAAHMGLGYTTRKDAEFVIMGTKGKPVRLNADVRQTIMAPRGENSEKPIEVHNRIERLYPGPYLEIFGRRQRRGWEVIGNEADLFEQLMI